MTLGAVWILWALLVVPILAIAFALDGQRRRKLLARIGHLPQIRRMTKSVSVGRRRFKAFLVVLAIALVVVALSRPQRPGAAHMLPRRGLDIVVALDFSRSMLAADVYPSRLERAKYELSRMLDGLKGDRVGLVAFAGVTLSYPLTSDYSAAKLFWKNLGPEDIPVGGSNLGEAIKAGTELLKHGHRQAPADTRAPSQVMVLLTDGSDTENGALEAAKAAAKEGIKIFTVGIGTKDGEVVVLKKKDDGTAEYVTDALGTPVRMQLDEAGLKQIADTTGGSYFRMDAERFGVDRVQAAIAGLERTEEETRIVREPEEIWVWFLGPAFALLVVETLLGERRKRKKQATDSDDSAQGEDAPTDRTERARRRLGGRRRVADATGAGAALMLVLSVIGLGGWTPFERQSPDVREGNEMLAAGKAQEALAAFDRALAKTPDDLVVHYDRGSALYALGKLPEAQKEFQRATESSDPTMRADAFYNMGNAILQQMQPKQAIDAYKRALRLRPDDRRAKWNLEMALKMLQQQEQQKKQQQQQGDNKEKQDDNKQQQGDNKQDQKDPSKQDEQKQASSDENKGAEQKPDQKKPEKPQDPEDKQAEQQPKPEKPDDKQAQPQPQNPENKDKSGDQKAQAAAAAQADKKPLRDIDRQDAEAVLDAFERVEPTVQKDLARKKAKNAHPRKDW